MAEPFASEGWFDLATDLACGRVEPTADDPSRRIQFDAVDAAGGHIRWHLVLEGGALTTWAPGDVEQPDLELHWALDDARAVHRGEASGTDALAAVRLADGSDPSPLDIAETAELADLPALPGATLGIQYHFAAGPFGPFSYWWAFEDGASRAMGLGTIDEPDASVWISFQKMVGVRTGEISVLEALEGGGRVDGAVGPLMLLAGLQESPELHAAELACGPSGPVLADLGRAFAVPQQNEGLVALARVTG